MSEWEVYLWLKLDAVQASLIFLALGSGFIFALCLIAINNKDCFVNEKDAGVAFKIGLRFMPFSLILLVVGLLTPTTKEYAVIKVLPKIVNSDFAKEAVGDAKMIYDVAKNYLKETLKVEAPDAKG